MREGRSHGESRVQMVGINLWGFKLTLSVDLLNNASDKVSRFNEFL